MASKTPPSSSLRPEISLRARGLSVSEAGVEDVLEVALAGWRFMASGALYSEKKPRSDGMYPQIANAANIPKACRQM
jgi:hypothetical protein